MPCIECEGPFPPLKCPHCGTVQRIDRSSTAWATAFLTSWLSPDLFTNDRGVRMEECSRLADEAVLALREARSERLNVTEAPRGMVEVPEALEPAQRTIHRLWGALREERPTAVAFYHAQLVRVLNEVPAEWIDNRFLRARDHVINMPPADIDAVALTSIEGLIFGGRLAPEAYPWPDRAPTEVTSEILHQVLEEIGTLVSRPIITRRERLNEFLDTQPEILAALHIIGTALELPPAKLRDFLDKSPSPLVTQWAADVLRATPEYRPLDEVSKLLFVMQRAAAEGLHVGGYRQDLVVALATAAMLHNSEALEKAATRVTNTPAYEFSPQLVTELQTLLYSLEVKQP